MKDFKRLKIWEKGMEIVRKSYLLVDLLPDHERYVLSSQIIRSAISIPSNIAEGSAKTSKTDYKRFLEISLGSSFEIETQILICSERYQDNDFDYENMLKSIDEEQKMLMSFIKKLVAHSS